MPVSNEDHIVNYEALLLASRRLGTITEKRSFVPVGGDGAAPPGGDPSGGMPPGGPPPGDPSGGGMPPGGPPPGDPSGGSGGGGGMDPAALQPMIQQAVQQAMMQQGGGGGGMAGSGAAGLKPKIDVNVEIMQMKNLLAKIVDHLGIPVPAQDMTATADKLNTMAQGGSTSTPTPAGGGAIGGIQPMQGMQGAGAPGGEKMGTAYRENGVAFDTKGFTAASNQATAILRFRQAVRASE